MTDRQTSPYPPWFLESELGRQPPQECLFHIIPAPFEKTVSDGRGTAGGPRAILEASQQLERYDGLDIDVLDPGIMPATGTPEPGGLSWYQLMEALTTVAAGRQVLGFDVVELAPQTHWHAANFTAARLVYNTMGIVRRSNNDATAESKRTYERQQDHPA